MYHKIIKQTAISVLAITTTVATCTMLRAYFDYRITALVLLFIVSIFAITCEIVPVIVAATLSALALNYFFIPPLYTFHIAGSNDVLLFTIFFIVAIMNAFINYKVRTANKLARDKEEKEKAIALYTTIFNSLSHELRTPLATIMASADTLTANPGSLTPVQEDILLEQIKLAGNRLNEQVENLLNMSRLESGMLQLKPAWCDINEVITELVHKTETAAPNQVRYTGNEEMPIVKTDIGIFTQALQNIVNNAIQHTPANTRIEIKAEIIEERELFVSVTDNGPGVASGDLPHLFDKFYRAPKTPTGGTGLGLSIVKGCADALNGRVLARHNRPTGLIIEIVLPVTVSYINKLNNE